MGDTKSPELQKLAKALKLFNFTHLSVDYDPSFFFKESFTVTVFIKIN